MIKREMVVYGIDNYSKVIDVLISDLKLQNSYYDVKLILIEALTNAFIHGNNGDKSKPIRILYQHNGQTIYFEIEDTNTEKNNIVIPDEINDEDILNDNGKGLFLIKALSDEVKIENNILYIIKQLSN